MPNWAMGTVVVTGAVDAVESFADRFVYSGQEPCTIPGKKYFARSFNFNERDSVKEAIRNSILDMQDGEKGSVELNIDFAWSVYTCIIAGYPDRFLESCITLPDACKEDQVSVQIRAFEPGMCFEEYVSCDEQGTLNYEEKSMPEYKCKDCGETYAYPSFEEPEDLCCYECGSKNLVRLEEERQ